MEDYPPSFSSQPFKAYLKTSTGQSNVLCKQVFCCRFWKVFSSYTHKETLCTFISVTGEMSKAGCSTKQQMQSPHEHPEVHGVWVKWEQIYASTLFLHPTLLHVWVSTWKRQQAMTGCTRLHLQLKPLKSGKVWYYNSFWEPLTASEWHKMFGDRFSNPDHVTLLRKGS